MTQQGDVILGQTPDDGEISVVGGLVGMSGGLETAAYLSLFGGNEEGEWWANFSESDPLRRYDSETQAVLDGLPATSGNLLKLEDAAERDLAWFVSEGVAKEVTVSATMPGLNRVNLTINIDGGSVAFVANWGARS